MCVHVFILPSTVSVLPCFKRLLASRNTRADCMPRIDSFRTDSLTSCRITSKPCEENSVAHPCPIKPAPTQAILLIPMSVPPLSFFPPLRVVVVFKFIFPRGERCKSAAGFIASSGFALLGHLLHFSI